LELSKIIVCIKHVPDPLDFHKVTIDTVTKTLKRENVSMIMNPLDSHALEAGLQMKEKHGGTIIVVTMGPPQAIESLRKCLAMGADEAILVCDKVLAGADSFATAYTLSRSIKKIGIFDLVLCGNESVDGSTAQVPPQLAVFLGLPHITRATKVDLVTNNKVLAKRSIEYGHMIVETQLPSVIAVTKEINTPRIPTVQSILESYQRSVTEWCVNDFEVEVEKIGLKGSPTCMVDLFFPEIGRKGEVVKGSPEKTANMLFQRLRDLGIITKA
jgi:electron transfer flavoprotein beta subunit